MYVNYLTGKNLHLGYLDEGGVRRIEGPPTDRLVTEGFPPVSQDAPYEDDPVRFAPAMLAPGKIICLMRSYRAHAEEGGHTAPAAPMFFTKLRNALLGHLEPIVIPKDLEGEVHHEGELALILGRGGKRLDPRSAAECVAGYTIANDVTARTLQRSDADRGWPWLRGKSLDTFLPLGPGILPAAEIREPQDLELRVEVNGLLRQHGNTSRLLWSFGEVLAEISRYMTLEPGDVVLTGTPEGVGSILPGDRVSVEIQGIGKLSNPVQAEI